MEKEAKIEVVETENKISVILSEEVQDDYQMIVSKIQEISRCLLTKQQAESFICCMVEVFFWHSDDVFELEDRIAEMAEVLTMYSERLKEGETNE